LYLFFKYCLISLINIISSVFNCLAVNIVMLEYRVVRVGVVAECRAGSA
jgi:uncharacterized membrane protein